MNRKVTVVGGAGNVGATVARAIAQKELADVVIVDIADTKAAGVALDIFQSCPIEGSAARVVGVGTKDFAESANSDVVVITVGRAAQARDEPRRSAVGQLQDHAGRDGRDRQALAQLHHRAGRQPARRDVAGGLSPEQISARARHRHGRRARLGPHADVHRHGAERLGRERLAFVLGGHGDTMVPLPRFSTVAGIPITELLPPDRIKAICDAHRQRRRRDHQAGRHERLVRARRLRGRDGRSDPEGSRRRSCRARCSCRASTASTTSSSACR